MPANTPEYFPFCEVNYCQNFVKGEFFMDTKKAVWIMMICGAAAAGLLAAPKIVLGAIPTATLVNVEKVEQSESLSLTGTILKNPREGGFCVQVYVPEQDVSRVSVGQTAEITGNAFPDTVYCGEVEKIADIASKIQSGNTLKTAVEVTVKINEPDDTLKHGYTSSVKLLTAEPSVMTVVPYEAVNQDENGEFLYVLNDGRAYKKYVETGREMSAGVELKTALSDSDRVITVDELAENGVSVRLSDDTGY